MSHMEPRTVRELIATLMTLDPNANVGAYGPSTMTVMPLYVRVADDGTVELLGDEMASGWPRDPQNPQG